MDWTYDKFSRAWRTRGYVVHPRYVDGHAVAWVATRQARAYECGGIVAPRKKLKEFKPFNDESMYDAIAYCDAWRDVWEKVKSRQEET